MFRLPPDHGTCRAIPAGLYKQCLHCDILVTGVLFSLTKIQAESRILNPESRNPVEMSSVFIAMFVGGFKHFIARFMSANGCFVYSTVQTHQHMKVVLYHC